MFYFNVKDYKKDVKREIFHVSQLLGPKIKISSDHFLRKKTGAIRYRIMVSFTSCSIMYFFSATLAFLSCFLNKLPLVWHPFF